MKDGDMDRTYDGWEKLKIHAKAWLEDLMEENLLEDPDREGRIFLKWVLKVRMVSVLI